MFVLKSLENIPTSVSWNAGLCRGIVCGPDFVISGSGPCITYHAALKSQRLLWMTDGFIQAHGRLANATIERILVQDGPVDFCNKYIRLMSFKTSLYLTNTFVPHKQTEP